MKTHEDLDAWKRAMALAKAVYMTTAAWPSEEKFGLTSQIRRAAVSVPSNVAEGSARGSDKDFAHFLDIALGSLAEVETQLLLAKEIGFCIEGISREDVADVRRPLIGLRNHLRTKR